MVLFLIMDNNFIVLSNTIPFDLIVYLILLVDVTMVQYTR
jgi:hypothetical protein